jgi:hypothetical protein
MTQKEIENKLDKLQDDFKEWKAIYGEEVPSGYEEPKDQAKVRQWFVSEINRLQTLAKST